MHTRQLEYPEAPVASEVEVLDPSVPLSHIPAFDTNEAYSLFFVRSLSRDPARAETLCTRQQEPRCSEERVESLFVFSLDPLSHVATAL